jgi:hypothetical protein
LRVLQQMFADETIAMSYYPQFGTLLNQQLVKLERTPAWLARRLGVKASTVGRWLNDGARPGSPETVIRIADVLGISCQRDKLLATAGYGYQEGNQGQVEPAQVTPPLPAVAPVTGSMNPPRSNLPQPVTQFVGRAVELAQLTKQLVAPNCHLMTLIGPGGIGKTRLAIETARQMQATQTNFVDGIFFISMAEHDVPEQLSYAIAEVLGLAVDAGLEIHNQVLNYLRDKNLLFVLDNFEHGLDAVDRVSQLLNAAPQVHVLATSRERLRLSGEHLFPVQGLSTRKLSATLERPG